LGQHLRINARQIFSRHAGNACGLIVGHGQGPRRGAVAVVVSLNFCQGCGLK
jgi:hypothetical protein